MRSPQRKAYYHCTVLRRVSRPILVEVFKLIMANSQPFWGNMVHAGGAGPAPIPFKSLNSSNLAEAILFCLTPEASTAARQIADKMSREAGVRRAVASFHANLPLNNMRCDLLPNRSAAWLYEKKGKKIKLSKMAAEILVEGEKVSWNNLKAYVTP